MKSVIKMGLVAAGSFALGYLVSNERNEAYYLVEAQRVADETAKEYDDELERLQTENEKFKERLANMGVIDKEDPTVVEFGEDPPSEVETAAAAALVDYQGGQREFYARHQKIAEEVKADLPAPETVTYMISEEEYRSNEKGHEQISLMYYSGDNVLATIEDNVVEEPGRTYALGPFDISKPELWEEYPALFLRNDALMQDYEIDHVVTSFAEEVG